MSVRQATCQCGALTATCEGEPVRVSVCHCFACQKRSGGPFAAQARFPATQVVLKGDSRQWDCRGDEGSLCKHHFCSACGSTLWYSLDTQPDVLAIPVGAFADLSFPPPQFSVYEDRQHPWVRLVGEGIEHYD